MNVFVTFESMISQLHSAYDTVTGISPVSRTVSLTWRLISFFYRNQIMLKGVRAE